MLVSIDGVVDIFGILEVVADHDCVVDERGRKRVYSTYLVLVKLPLGSLFNLNLAQLTYLYFILLWLLSKHGELFEGTPPQCAIPMRKLDAGHQNPPPLEDLCCVPSRCIKDDDCDLFSVQSLYAVGSFISRGRNLVRSLAISSSIAKTPRDTVDIITGHRPHISGWTDQTCPP